MSLELAVGETKLAAGEELPTGDLAVLPASIEVDGAALGTLTLHSPLPAVATLGRRMLGDAEPDKERELSTEELDSVGEVLNLWSGAIDAALREHVSSGARSRPLRWWRTAEPGENAFEPGPCVLASAALAVPGGGEVPLFLRIPDHLLETTGATKVQQATGIALLLGMDAGAAEALTRVLAGARFEVRSGALTAEDRAAAIAAAAAVFLSGDDPAALAACRELRLGNATWRKPAIVCMKEPTRSRVLEALRDGASGVLRLPADDMAVLRLLKESSA